MIPIQVFSCKICKIFKNTYFEEHLEATTSDVSKNGDKRVNILLVRHDFRGERSSGVRSYDSNRNVPGSNITRRSAGLKEPNHVPKSHREVENRRKIILKCFFHTRKSDFLKSCIDQKFNKSVNLRNFDF